MMIRISALLRSLLRFATTILKNILFNMYCFMMMIILITSYCVCLGARDDQIIIFTKLSYFDLKKLISYEIDKKKEIFKSKR